MSGFELLNDEHENINEFADYGSKLLFDASDLSLFSDNAVYSKRSTKVFVKPSEQCEFKFARQTPLDGILMKKGQRCEKARLKGKKFCETHQYAVLRRKRKADDSASVTPDIADTQETLTDTSLIDQITSIQTQLESIKKRLMDSQQK